MPAVIVQATDPGAIGKGVFWLNSAFNPAHVSVRDQFNAAWIDLCINCNDFDAETFFAWSPHWWFGDFGVVGAVNAAGTAVNTGSPRQLTPGIVYDWEITVSNVLNVAGALGGNVNVGFNDGNTPWISGGLVHTSAYAGAPTVNGTTGVGTPSTWYAAASVDHKGNGTTPSATVTFWMDPQGFVQTPPTAPVPNSGDHVINDRVNETPDGIRTLFTLTMGSQIGGYTPTTLVATKNGTPAAKVETNPVAGTFTFAVAPAIGVTVRASYTAV